MRTGRGVARALFGYSDRFMRWRSHGAAVLPALLVSGAAIAMPGPEDGPDRGRTLATTVRVAEPVEEPRTPEPALEPEPEPEAEDVEPAPPGPTPSLSIGRANRGRLRNGVQLQESELIRFKNGSPEHTRWGTAELVGMLERAAAHVARVLPGGRLTVGDLSRRNGGWFRPHRSHRSGRDADIVFYTMDEEEAPLEPITFVRYGRSGRGRGHHGQGTRFDDERNWELVAAMLTDRVAEVQYVFVSRRLRARLLETGERRGAAPDLLEKASIALEQPRRGGRHDDHFHVRIYCPADDLPRCRDTPPWRPWHPAP